MIKRFQMISNDFLVSKILQVKISLRGFTCEKLLNGCTHYFEELYSNSPNLSSIKLLC